MKTRARRGMTIVHHLARAWRHRSLGRRFEAGTMLLLASAWLTPAPDYPWSFPRDHWTHPGYRTEWWYLTGHLESEDGRRFGYQFTFFRVGILPVSSGLDSRWAATDLVMAHAALTELDADRHRFSELLYRSTPFLGGFPRWPGNGSDPPADAGVLAWSRGPVGTDGGWRLGWNGQAFSFEMADDAAAFAFQLQTRPVKPKVLQGPNGFSRKGEGATAASLYYSFTRLKTQGSLWIDGEEVSVRGLSWMDKEFGSGQLSAEQVGWDWFSLQLDDGREVMLYLLRDRQGRVDHARGTRVDEDATVVYLEEDDWELQVTRRWTSPHTGAEYPAGWRLQLEGETVWQIRPLLDEQENRSRLAGGLFYWEGAVELMDEEGSPVGQGYVELTGYGTKNRPAL